MSMISGQIDRLRTAAQTYRRLGNHSAESMLLDAADTIWKLRDDLQRANADNAKLREQVERLRTQLADMTESVGRVEERCAKTFEVGKRWMAKAARFEAENTKLRELCEDMHAALQAFCDAQDVHGDNCPLWVERTDDCELRGIERRMRELGVDA